MQKVYFLYEPGTPRLRYSFRSVPGGFRVKKTIGESGDYPDVPTNQPKDLGEMSKDKAGELIRSLDLRPYNGNPVDPEDWEQGLYNYHTSANPHDCPVCGQHPEQPQAACCNHCGMTCNLLLGCGSHDCPVTNDDRAFEQAMLEAKETGDWTLVDEMITEKKALSGL